MPSSPAPASHISPPRGLIEAAKKLNGWQALKPAFRARRLQQAAESLTFAIAWAELETAGAAGPDALRWATAVAEMKRAEQLTKALTAEAEREAKGWDSKVPEIREIFVAILAIYAAAAEAVPPANRLATVRYSTPPDLEPRREPVIVEDALFMFRTTVERMGLREGLAYLVGLTRYRYAGLWQFERGDQRALAVYDRYESGAFSAGGSADCCGGCVYVQTRAGIKTLDELLGVTLHAADRRRRKHYHSVPVVAQDGNVLATLCLHDTVARTPVAGEAELLKEVARFLAERQALFLA